MELGAKGRHLPFKTASARLKDRFGITMGDDTFIEKAYWIWRNIGNIAVDVKAVSVTISSDLVVTLPQDCEFVRSLSTTEFADDLNFDGSFNSYQFTPNGRTPESRPDPGATSLEASARASISTVPGERVDYKSYDKYLQVTSPVMSGKQALLIYNAMVVDEEGLPMLNDPEAEAIAVTLALQKAEEGLFRKEPGADKLVGYLKPESDRLLCAAKADEKISDDGFDKLLDVKTTWDRKVFGNRFPLA